MKKYKLKESLYFLIELILSIVLIFFGSIITSSSSYVKDYLPFIINGFILIKIVLIILKGFTFDISKILTFIEAIANTIIIVMVFIFNKGDSISFVVSASMIVDFSINICKSFLYQKSAYDFLRRSFFGMENVIAIIFFVFLIFNQDSKLVATGVLFGSIILYKGISILIGNGFVRKLINKTDFGEAVAKVHGLDIFFALLIIVVLASCIFPYIEEGFENSGDALWYCFTLITTIGTGDFVAKTTLGRIISIVIGSYGIILVSVLTSAFVVYLNKVSRKKDNRFENVTSKNKKNKD